MVRYVGTPQFAHPTPERLGVLLVNLGTPDAPTPSAVRRFLAEFLSDPRVIEVPRLLWLPVLHGVILRIRPRRSAHAYRQVWTERGSPLMFHSQDLASRLATALTQQIGPNVVLALGMSYGNPSIPMALERLRQQGATRLLVLPLYPQYSGTTTASVFDRVTTVLQQWRWVPEVRFIMQYHDTPQYIEAIADTIRRHWAERGQKHLLFSFHGVPRSYLLEGDPYFCQCQKTARLVSERLNLGADDFSVSFQSQVGRAEWLRPYTNELLTRFAKESRRDVTVVCPGFAIDCLETLEEIELRNRDTFLTEGGNSYDYVPALNASDAHVSVLTELLMRHTQGWPHGAEALATDPQAAPRARRLGAQR